MDNMIVKDEGIEENNAIIKADVRDGKYCLMVEKYFAEKQAKNEQPDFDEWFEEHEARLEKLKEDLVRFYELTHLPAETIEKIFQLAWEISMEYIDIEDDEERMEALEDLVDRFAQLADLFKV